MCHVLVRADGKFVGSQLPEQYVGALRNTAPVMILSDGWFYGDYVAGNIKNDKCWWPLTPSRPSTFIHFRVPSIVTSVAYLVRYATMAFFMD